VLLDAAFHALRHAPQIFTGWHVWWRVILCGGGAVQLWFLIFLFYAQALVYPVLRRRERAAPRARGAGTALWPLGLAAAGVLAVRASSGLTAPRNCGSSAS
jgi:hypothetical protein